MKKILLISLCAGLMMIKANAQQDAQYSQFFANKLAYNSGFAGTENKICVTGLFRSQWIGFGSGEGGESPTTFVGNIHSPLGQHFGVGLNIISDRLGFTNNLNAILSAAYRYTFKNDAVLSAGIGGGFYQQSLLGTKLKPLQTGDNLIPTNDVSGIAADFNLGLYFMKPTLWKFDDFYAGISTTHLNQGLVEYANNKMQMKLHYYLLTGAVYQINSSLDIEPNLLVKFDQAKLTTDINIMAMFNNKIRGGLTYRTVDALAILVGYKFTPTLQLGLSYDYTTSNIRDFSNGTIEVMAKYCFMPKIETKPEKPPIPRLSPRFL